MRWRYPHTVEVASSNLAPPTVNIRRTRQEQFVVTAFMRSFVGFRRKAPMNRGTTNGLDEYLLCRRLEVRPVSRT